MYSFVKNGKGVTALTVYVDFFFLTQPWRCIKDLSLFKYYLGLKVTRFQQGNAILKYVPASFERDRDASTKASR